MKRRSQLISFLLTMVMLLGVFFVLPKEVRADLSDDYFIDDETEVKINDGLARTYYAPKDTGYYIFYCDAWGTDVSQNTTTAMVKDTDTNKLLEFFSYSDLSISKCFYYKLEAGKKYEITFSFSSEFTYAKITTMREFLFIKDLETLSVDYGSDKTLVAEAYSPYGEITYTWDKGGNSVSGPELELKNISKKSRHTCYVSVKTPKGTVTSNCLFYIDINNSDFGFEGDKERKEIAVPYGSDYTLKIVRSIPMPENCEIVWYANGEQIEGTTSTTCTIKNITKDIFVYVSVGYKRDFGYVSQSIYTTLYPENDLAISIKGAKTASEGAFKSISYEFMQGDNPYDLKDKEVSYIVVDPSKSITIEAELKGRDLSGSSITWSRDETVLSKSSTVTIDPDFYTHYQNKTQITVKGQDKYGRMVTRDLYLVPQEYEGIINDPFKTIEVKKGEDVTLSVDPAVTIPEWDVMWEKTDDTGCYVTFIYPYRNVSSITAENITEETYYDYWACTGNFSLVYQRFRIVPVTPTPTPTSAPTATPKATATPKVTATPAVTGTPSVAPTTAPADPKAQILAFVERIYIYVLDREPEAEGAAFWSDELYSFRRTGAEVAQGFIFSDEFVNRKTSDKEFVTILYKTFFGRDPEEEGLNFWLSQLASGTMDRVTVANGFIYSQEWADTCASYGIRSGGDLKPTGKIAPTELTYAFVERMYTTAMGRGYDEEGKQYWAGELANFNITGEFVGASFFLSDEMNGYNLSDKEYLGRLYATFMNREPDADGEAYWLSQMSAGVPRADIVFGFTRSPEFTDKCIEARILPYV